MIGNPRSFIIALMSISVLISCTGSKEKTAAETMITNKKVTVSNTAGWQLDDQATISQPSNIISQNGYSYVFYVKEPLTSPIAGSGYGGTIHYAFSRDQGHTWSDQGLLINKGLAGSFDAGGVSKPTVIKVTDAEFFYLYYVGVSDQFTNADGSEANKSHIGLVKLLFNPDGPIRLAIKLNTGSPIITNSQDKDRFDSYRVDDPKAINMNGQAWIYYTGYDKFGGAARTGLVISSDINQGHIKQNNNHALLDGIPSLLQKQNIGVLAVFTETQNAWYAEDGIHFQKLKKQFPAPLKKGSANADQPKLSWGLTEPLAKGNGFGRWEIN
jgi:hypothetical protein